MNNKKQIKFIYGIYDTHNITVNIINNIKPDIGVLFNIFIKTTKNKNINVVNLRIISILFIVIG